MTMNLHQEPCTNAVVQRAATSDDHTAMGRLTPGGRVPGSASITSLPWSGGRWGAGAAVARSTRQHVEFLPAAPVEAVPTPCLLLQVD